MLLQAPSRHPGRAVADATATRVPKVCEGIRPNIVDRLKNDEIALVMNTTEGTQAISDSRDIRRVALMDKTRISPRQRPASPPWPR